MNKLQQVLVRNLGYIFISAIACASAAFFALLHDAGPIPVLDVVPLYQATVCAAFVGYPCLLFLRSRAICGSKAMPANLRQLAALIGLGAMLAVPPVTIDIFSRFPRDINVLVPNALLFYPAIALVAEVTFHLLPLATLTALTGLTSKRTAPLWVFVVVVFVEPVFQATYSYDSGIQAWLVLANVGLISAAQIWLFTRYGFGAMITLRLAFYFFWHVAWGTARLAILF
ncbi:hypothetical protein ACXYMP_12855 [Aliiroseovarius sp. CAU 1755]